MRVMAIDYGDSRTGVALSDMTGSITGESFVIHEKNTARLLGRLDEAAKARNVTRIVIGYPLNMNNTVGERAEKCKEISKALQEKTGIQVDLWDERLSSMEAYRILNTVNVRGQKRKDTVDAVAASLILEGYLASLGKR